MSSRRIVCFFPSASSRSIEVFVSPASRPFRTRPSVVETVYWRKFPSTDRLGSRMWTISSLLGCAAMPVRSGPTLPPSPECVWHFAHSFLKISLPREASPPFRTIGASAWMTFSRSGSGSPPPLASRALARSAIVLSGWAARACDWSSERRDIGTLPASIPLDQRVRPVGLAEQRQDARLAGRRGHRPHRVHQRRADLGRVAPRHGGDQAAREVGRGLRRDEGDHVARGLRVGLAEVDQLPGGVDAGRLGLRSRRRPRRGSPWRAGRRTRPAPSRPSARRGRASGRGRRSRASAGGRRWPSRRRRRASAALSLGQPFARPAMMASRTCGSALCERPGSRGDRVDRPARA